MKIKFKEIFLLAKRHVVRAMTHNLALKMVAALLTLTLFALVAGESVQMSKRVNLEYITAEDMMIVNTVPFEFEIVLSGQKSAIGIVRGQDYYYKVDLTGVGVGTSRIRLDTRQLNLPRGVVVSSILPSRIYPKLEKVITKKVEVKLKLNVSDSILKQYTVRVEPSEIEIKGPEEKVSLISVVETESVDFPYISKSKTLDVNLLPVHVLIKMPGLPTGKVKVYIEKKK